MSKIYKMEISIPAVDNLEALLKLNALTEMAKNISTDNLLLLGQSSQRMGVNLKIQSFKNYL